MKGGEPPQTRKVAWHRVVVEVALHDRLEPWRDVAWHERNVREDAKKPWANP